MFMRNFWNPLVIDTALQKFAATIAVEILVNFSMLKQFQSTALIYIAKRNSTSLKLELQKAKIKESGE
jgi:hypothetical protein